MLRNTFTAEWSYNFYSLALCPHRAHSDALVPAVPWRRRPHQAEAGHFPCNISYKKQTRHCVPVNMNFIQINFCFLEFHKIKSGAIKLNINVRLTDNSSCLSWQLLTNSSEPTCTYPSPSVINSGLSLLMRTRNA